MTYVHQHAISILFGWYVFSAIVSGMPTPLLDERGYQWLYVTLHAIAGSIGRAGATLYPQMFAQPPLTQKPEPAVDKPVAP